MLSSPVRLVVVFCQWCRLGPAGRRSWRASADPASGGRLRRRLIASAIRAGVRPAAIGSPRAHGRSYPILLEHRHAQRFIAQAAVEAFDEGALHLLGVMQHHWTRARSDEARPSFEVHSPPVSPAISDGPAALRGERHSSHATRTPERDG